MIKGKGREERERVAYTREYGKEKDGGGREMKGRDRRKEGRKEGVRAR